MNKKKKLTAEEIFALALQNHKKNNLQVAKNYYNETLRMNLNHVDAHNNLVKSCVACHTNFCQGPISRIELLYIN